MKQLKRFCKKKNCAVIAGLLYAGFSLFAQKLTPATSLSITTQLKDSLSSNEPADSFLYLPYSLHLSELHLAQATYQKEMNQAESYRFPYMPSLSFSAKASASGELLRFSGLNSVKEAFSNADCSSSFASASLVLHQRLPGAASADFSVDVPFSYSFQEYEGAWSIAPSVGFSVPLTFSHKLIKANDAFIQHKYRRKKSIYGLSLKTDGRMAYKKFFESASDFIYCSALEKIYDKKQELLEFQLEESERLFIMGRITTVELNQLKNQLQEFYQTQMENKTKKIQMYCELNVCGDFFLKEMGDKEALGKEVDYEQFLNEWEEYVQTFFPEQNNYRNAAILENQDCFADEVEALVQRLPFLSATISTSTDSQKFGQNLEFSNVSWNASFGFSIPILSGNSDVFGRKGYAKANLVYIQKKQILEKQAQTVFEERKVFLQQYKNYYAVLSNAAELEKQRLENYKALNDLGRLSDFDLNMQLLALEIAKLKALNARALCISTMLGFY